jgi:hypothetical protein
MNQLIQAREALVLAHADMDAMRKANTPVDMRKAWIAFLINLNRAYNKAYAKLSTVRKFEGWAERGRLKALRARDPLIAYLKNSRHADEHGASLALETEANIEFHMKAGSRGLWVDKVEARLNGHASVEGVRGDVDVRVTPPKFELVAVKNRSTFPVPNTHLGIALPSREPIVLAEAGSLLPWLLRKGGG